MSRQRLVLVLLSLLGHLGIFLLTGVIPVPEAVETVMVTMRVVEPPSEPPQAPPPEPAPAPEAPPSEPAPAPPRPAPPRPAPPRPQRAAPPAPDAAPTGAPGDGLPPLATLGVTLTGGTGYGGIAVAEGRPDGAAGGQGAAPGGRQGGGALAAAAPGSAPARCAGVTRPPGQPRGLRRPLYPAEALAARRAGRVRVALTLDAGGRVVRARPLDTPGLGLEEAAVASLQDARFQPALRCGVPAPGEVIIAVRFEL